MLLASEPKLVITIRIVGFFTGEFELKLTPTSLNEKCLFSLCSVQLSLPVNLVISCFLLLLLLLLGCISKRRKN